MKRVLIGLILLAALAAGVMRVLEIRPRVPAMVKRSVESPEPAKVSESAAVPPVSEAKSTAPTPKLPKYDAAKEHIRNAKLLLGDVAREQPGTADAYYARLQAAALENIFATDVPVAPVTLSDPITWRVLRVETTEAHSKVTVEVENPNLDRSQCFYIFDHKPLVVVAGRKVYAMKRNAIERPANVETCYGNDRWSLQPTQAITLDVYFDALDPGTLDGMVKYADDDFREKPALFSLVNVHQSSAP